MTIDNHTIVSKSARFYSAIGGGWGVKMNIKGGKELLFGCYADKATAEQLVSRANRLTHNTTVDALERGEQERSMSNGMIEVRVTLTAEEARAISITVDAALSIDGSPAASCDCAERGSMFQPHETARNHPSLKSGLQKIVREIRGYRPAAPPRFKLAGAT